MEYAFHIFNSLSSIGMTSALRRLQDNTIAPPVVVCIGSDLAIGDSLGPIVGTLLERNLDNPRAYIYGTLRSPITAKEIKYIGDFIKKTHPNSKIIAIDAAVGDESEIGLIKLTDGPLSPGSGANKRLGKIGDVSILGIIAKKSAFSYTQLNLTRLNTVYMMADSISKAVSAYLNERVDEYRAV